MINITNFLVHYASPYYDPVKAREYYLRTRELKGRKAAEIDTAEKRDILGYTRKTINEKRQADTKQALTDQQRRVEEIRAKAEATRDRIESKLIAYLEKVAKDLLEVKLNKIPESASPKLRAFLEKQNASIRGSAQRKASKASQAAREQARSEMKAVGEGLKKALNDARNSYKAQREAIQTKYEEAERTEYEKIKNL